jgi:excinuclease ABC subunit A
MAKEFIKIGGAREHNLKNLTLNIPRDKLVVITGLSGSGKSSLAFDTIYAEGQRKYVESLSAYARQFLDQMQPSGFHRGLSPAIAIEQRSSGTNPRSIIATTTEIYDYLRLLFANVGQAHCPNTANRLLTRLTDIVDKIFALPPRTRVMLLAPIIRHEKVSFGTSWNGWRGRASSALELMANSWNSKPTSGLSSIQNRSTVSMSLWTAWSSMTECGYA